MRRSYFKVLGLIFCLSTLMLICYYKITSNEYEQKYKFYFYSEVKNPKSAFYGLHFLKSYGQSVNSSQLKIDKYTDKILNWTTYFPKLSRNLALVKKLNPKLDGNLATCANYTQVILDGTKQYNVGDQFKAVIQAKNCNGNKKNLGGDYFRSKLTYGDFILERPSGIAAQITDHSNGTYTISAELLFKGMMQLEVLLVSSVESISNIIYVTSEREYKGATYECELETGELVECNVDLTVNERYKKKDLCDYTLPRNLEPWFAVKPISGVCSPIKNVVFKQSNNVNGEPSYVFPNIDPIAGSGYTFFVDDGKLNSGEIQLCNLEDNLVSGFAQRPNGFFSKGQWWSLECRRSMTSLDKLDKCLRNTVIYFIGDSTSRQFFTLVMQSLFTTLEGPASGTVWQQPKVSRSHKNNITMYYRAHGPPLQNPGPPSSRPYFSDQFDQLKGGKNVYIIMNYGPHVYFYEPSVYIHRLLGARDALKRLLDRYPDTQVIIKGNNVLNWAYEWLGKRQDMLMYNIFKGMKSVKFIDLWDFGTVWPLETANFHPYPDPLEQQASHIFSHICPKLK